MSEVFDNEMGRLNDVLCAVNLLVWDARTQMPGRAAVARGRQIATLTGLAREIATGPALADAIAAELEKGPSSPTDALRRRALTDTQAAIAVLQRVPAALVTEVAALKSEAQAVWIEARAANDFARFAPLLDRTVALQRQVAEAIGYAEHPYDALLGQYEPGMTLARLRPLYATLRAGLLPLIDKASAAPQPRVDVLERSYPVEAQRRFALGLAERMGYDLTRGRLDDTVHPFEISMTREDVRITGRFRENWLPGGLFAIWHEAGHGLYEQAIDPAFTRSIFATDLLGLYAVGGASFGMHESQSRLLENRIGRSQRFWTLHFASLRDNFPTQLADVDALEFWAAVNATRASLIRVEADELTYDLHIMLRTEIEAGLVAGDIAVRDLPALWAERMRNTFGLTVPDDSRGVLQDVHWASGMIGSFPTYTLGNIMSSQLFQAACRTPGVHEGLADADYAPLRRWLNEHVHRHGRSRTPDEILRAATGSGLDPQPYLADLAAKVCLLGDYRSGA